MTTYSEKLRDPRWQKKRLEVFQRDKFTCQKCEDTEMTLNVHHRRYLPGKEPWEYPDELLVTLCEECHEEETILWPEEMRNIEKILCYLGCFASDLNGLNYALARTQERPKVFLEVITYLAEPEHKNEFSEIVAKLEECD